MRVPNGDYEDSDSGDSSNTSTSSGPGGSKKENQNKTTQVRCGTSCYRSANNRSCNKVVVKPISGCVRTACSQLL